MQTQTQTKTHVVAGVAIMLGASLAMAAGVAYFMKPQQALLKSGVCAAGSRVGGSCQSDRDCAGSVCRPVYTNPPTTPPAFERQLIRKKPSIFPWWNPGPDPIGGKTIQQK